MNAANALILHAEEPGGGLILSPLPDGRLRLQIPYSSDGCVTANIDRASVVTIRDYLTDWLSETNMSPVAPNAPVRVHSRASD